MRKLFVFLLLCHLFIKVETSFLLAQEAELQKAEELTARVVKLYQQGRYEQALPFAQEALLLREQALVPEHPNLAQSINNLAELYRAMGAYSQAEPLFQRAMKIWEKQLDNNHLDMATSLNNFAGLYQDTGDFSKAELLYQQALKIWEKQLGPEHLNVANCLNSLAFLYYRMGKYGQSEPLFHRALNIREAKLGSEHPDFASILNNLALLYNAIGDYSQAEPLFKRALMIRELKLGENHPDFAQSLHNLASFYHNLGFYDQAEPYYQRSLKIWETTLGTDHLDVATSLNNLAFLYYKMGKYGQAEFLYKRALKIREAKLSSDHPDLAVSLNNLALIYKSMGALSQAESYYLRALNIQETKLGPKHVDLSITLNNLAVLYRIKGAYNQAESYYNRALKIQEVTLGPEHPEVSQTLNNLAILYENKGAYTHAKKYHNRALLIRETKLGYNHPDVAASLYNLALLYYKMGNYSLAERSCKRVLKIRNEKLGPNHPDVASSLINLLYFWGAQASIDSIIPAAKQLLQKNFYHYHNILPYLSEKRQLDYVQVNSPLYPLWPSLYKQYGQQLFELKYLIAQFLLNHKGIVYEILSRRSLYQKSISNPLNDSLNNIRVKLANAFFIDPALIKNTVNHLNFIKSLQEQQDEIESQIGRQSYKYETIKTPITPVQLSQELNKKYVLIDFLHFENYNFIGEKKGFDSWEYLAVVYQKNKEPQIILLAEADSINKNIRELLPLIFTTKLDSCQTRQQYLAAEANVKAKGQLLYRQLFQPLLAVIGDKKKLIICADGDLHYLPIGVMVDEQNRYLVESYQFHYVSTAREVLKWQSGPRPALRDAVIIADPQFDAALADAGTRGDGIITNRSREWRQMSFPALKHTGPEAIAIDSLLRLNKVATKLYLKGQAQESVLKAVHSPQILHLSSHGFFWRAPKPVNPPVAAGPVSFASPVHQGLVENPLVRCGLALAGANRAESIPGSDDGLATALELAGLDLIGTDLVTLSACETGIGDLKNGEGLYGLHRSFLLAGAKTVLASLWSVPDLETRDLMIEFYRRYLSDLNISKTEALRQAQLAVIKSLREKYGVAPPAYWGAFVCIGEPGDTNYSRCDSEFIIQYKHLNKKEIFKIKLRR